MSINEIQDDIIEEFSCLDDWMDRYALLIDMGNALPTFPEEKRIDKNLIDGCQSKVWIDASLDIDNTGRKIIRFVGDSDALLVKGIVALLLRVLNEQTPDDIANADLYFIDQIQLREHLSPTRNNGVVAMLKQMRLYALALRAL